MMVPWHCWPFLALFCGDNNGSHANNWRNYQGSGYADKGALALFGVPWCVQQCAMMKCGNSLDNGALTHCPFLALLRDGDNVSSANDSA